MRRETGAGIIIVLLLVVIVLLATDTISISCDSDRVDVPEAIERTGESIEDVAEEFD